MYSIHDNERKALPEWFKGKKGATVLVYLFRKMTNFRSHKSCTSNTETILFNLENKDLYQQQELEKD